MFEAVKLRAESLSEWVYNVTDILEAKQDKKRGELFIITICDLIIRLIVRLNYFSTMLSVL